MESSKRQDLLQAIAGPVVLGGVLGIPMGTSALLQEAATLPAVLFGTTLLMVPALYIGSTILGVAPSAQAVARAVGKGLSACGALLLGLAPLCAFLLVTTADLDMTWFFGTSDHFGVVWLFGVCALATGLFFGLRALRDAMFKEEKKALWLPLFWSWSFVALLVGERLFTRTFVSA